MVSVVQSYAFTVSSARFTYRSRFSSATRESSFPCKNATAVESPLKQTLPLNACTYSSRLATSVKSAVSTILKNRNPVTAMHVLSPDR